MEAGDQQAIGLLYSASVKHKKRQRHQADQGMQTKQKNRRPWFVVFFILALIVVFYVVLQSQEEPVQSNSFDGDRALETVEQLCLLGNRHYGASKREQAIQYLRERLESHVDQLALQRFTATEEASGVEHKLTNIIGRQAPELKRRLIIATHWDTRAWAEEDSDVERRDEPIVGANDGTSGVAVLLELARVLQDRSPQLPLGVDYVMFDGEEFGRPNSDDFCQGSKYFARMLKSLYPRSRPELAIVVDMVGDCDQRLLPERSSAEKAPRLVSRIWGLAGNLGYGQNFALTGTPSIENDHTALQAAGIQSTLLIDYDYPHWHTHQDTVDKVCASSLEGVGKVLEQFLLNPDEDDTNG